MVAFHKAQYFVPHHLVFFVHFSLETVNYLWGQTRSSCMDGIVHGLNNNLEYKNTLLQKLYYN